ncbi:MAG TPA: MMPL family transporter, partial [Myxococcaceae bacterium]|nr:MMPL family transporter [Myxococcaceae bacterium]
MFAHLARAVYRHRVLVFIASSLMFLAAGAAVLRGGELTTGTIEGTEAAQVEALTSGASAGQTATSLAVLFHSDAWGTDDPRYAEAVRAALARAAALPSVAATVSPWDAPTLAARWVAATGKDAMAVVRLKGDAREAARAYPAVR